MCEVAAGDESAQQFICDCFAFTPLCGKVCINKIPPKVKSALEKNQKLLAALREVRAADRQRKFWCYPPFPSVLKGGPNAADPGELASEFPDPAEHWLGFLLFPENAGEKRTALASAKQTGYSWQPQVRKRHSVFAERGEEHEQQRTAVEEEESTRFLAAGSGSESATRFLASSVVDPGGKKNRSSIVEPRVDVQRRNQQQRAKSSHRAYAGQEKTPQKRLHVCNSPLP